MSDLPAELFDDFGKYSGVFFVNARDAPMSCIGSALQLCHASGISSVQRDLAVVLTDWAAKGNPRS